MSTLLVTLEFPPDSQGGIASWAWDLAWALHRSGESVHVLAKNGPGSASDAVLPFSVTRMRGRSWGRWQHIWARLAGGRMLGGQPRVVFSTWKMATRLGPVAKEAGCRVGIAAHGSDLTRLMDTEPGLLRADQCADCWLPASEFLASELQRVGATSPIRVLPMPLQIDIKARPHRDREGLIVLARMTHLKGVERAITLAQALGESLCLVGDGPERARLEETWGDRVQFLGSLPREEAMEKLAVSRSIVLLPRKDSNGSGAEGLGLCILEAAARGVPAIGCATGGLSEALGPGLLVDPETPDLVAVRQFLQDPNVGDAARQWVQASHGPAACLQALAEALG
jgi:glycosyltransferase involved in cell wall biosynthesis